MKNLIISISVCETCGSRTFSDHLFFLLYFLYFLLVSFCFLWLISLLPNTHFTSRLQTRNFICHYSVIPYKCYVVLCFIFVVFLLFLPFLFRRRFVTFLFVSLACLIFLLFYLFFFCFLFICELLIMNCHIYNTKFDTILFLFFSLMANINSRCHMLILSLSW